MSELSTKAKAGRMKQTGSAWKTGKPGTVARTFLFALCCVVVPIRTALASNVDYSKASINELVDSLALIDSQAPGIDSAVMYGGFIADDTPMEFQGGVLGFPPPQVPPQMRELVRRGMSALPALIAHLDDARPTKLAVGNDEDGAGPQQKHVVGLNFFMFTVFSDEYDPRLR